MLLLLLSLMRAHGAFEPMEKMRPSCGGGIEVLLLVFVGGAAMIGDDGSVRMMRMLVIPSWTVVTIEVVPLPAVLASS